MTATAIEREPYEVPEGGLASFLTATEGDWSDAALEGPETGYVVQMADKLAQYGREGDTKLAHVAPGETVVPLEVLDADPELKNRLFAQMRDMGLEPERYIVGSELNSLNPTTGQPEFFLKKIFKGIKKAVKGVVKVFKKIAPIVLPIALNFMFPGLGAIASGALGSGIGTLVQGGSLKDAFKSALIGGAVGGLASGVSGAISGEGFIEGVKGGLPGGTFGGGAPTKAPIETGVPDFVAGTETGVLPPALDTATVAAGATPTTAQQAVAQAVDPSMVASTTQAAVESPLTVAQGITDPSMVSSASTAMTADPIGMAGATTPATPPVAKAPMTPAPQAGTEQAAQAAGDATMTNIGSLADITPAARQAVDPGFFASIKQFFSTGNPEFLKQAFLPGTSPDVVIQRLKKANFTVTPAMEAQVAEALAPGMLRTYLPGAAVGLGTMKVAGLMDPPPMSDLSGDFVSEGSKLYRMYPERFNLAAPGSGYVPITAANGGDISSFPRKNGAIYGPGTETSDDVPAMLSDGEFVMTARAVRGAGNGSRELGMRRMYDMMRKFEGGAVRG